MDIVYWDSNCCLKWLKEEEGFERCKGTLKKASKKELQIRTSSYTLIEVLYLETNGEIDRDKSEKAIKDFFDSYHVIPIVPDIPLMEKAREIFFDFNIKPPDLLHVASAIYDGIEIFHTFDDKLLKKDGMIGNPPLKIIKPHIDYQESLALGTEEK